MIDKHFTKNSVAIYYGRHSSELQNRGTSKARQSDGFERFLPLSGLPKHKEDYYDEGKSGFTGEHLTGDFGRLLSDCQEGKLPVGSVIWIENMDRFGRMELVDTVAQLAIIFKAGLGLYDASQGMIFWKLDMQAMGLMFSSVNGNGQSSKLQGRLLEVNERKRMNRDGVCIGAMRKGKKTEAIPCWLVLTEDGKGYAFSKEDRKVIPKKLREDKDTIMKRPLRNAQTLREACLLSIAGFGVRMIEAKLKEQGKTININGLVNLFKSRALIGEYQPAKRINKRTKEEVGNPIPGYYPSLLSADEFKQLQAGLLKRAGTCPQTARTKKVSCLFTGLLWNQKGETMGYKPMGMYYPRTKDKSKPKDKSKAKKRHDLISPYVYDTFKDGVGIGGKWSEGHSVRYNLVEEALLSCFLNVSKEDLFPTNTTNEQREVANLKARIEDGETAIERLKDKFKQTRMADYLEMIPELRDQVDEDKTKLAEVEHKLTVAKSDTLGTAQQLIEEMEELSGDMLLNYRARLKDIIKGLVKSITLEVFSSTSCGITVEFQNGLKRETTTGDFGRVNGLEVAVSVERIVAA